MDNGEFQHRIFLIVFFCVSIITFGCHLFTPGNQDQPVAIMTTTLEAKDSIATNPVTPKISLGLSPTIIPSIFPATDANTLEPIKVNPTETPIPPIRFAVIGDYGLSKNPERDVANLVKNWNPDFIITVGDNNYPDGQAETIDENIGQYYHEFIFPYIGEFGSGSDVNRFFPTLGNHDWTTVGAQPYFDYFTLPGNERYYDFVWGPVHFFALDSDSREPDGVGRSSIQAQWLKDKLGSSTSPWKIVYMHHPPYSSSSDGSISWAQWPHDAWGVDAVLSGHAHVYERLIVDDFPYFINGLGGGPRYDFDMPIAGSEVRFRDDYGAMFVEATTDQIVFQFITRDNITIDTFSIHKY